MRLRLGEVNLALVSLYFAPAWGGEALRALRSPYNGFDDRAHAAVAVLIRDVFDLGLTGLMRTSSLIAGIKLVIASAFLACLIELARALVTRREPDVLTIDAVVLAGLALITLWMMPALITGDLDLVRLEAAQFLLLVGAAIVISIERHIEAAQARSPRAAANAASQESELALPATAPPAPRSGLPAGQPA
jgi:hypothetical protein